MLPRRGQELLKDDSRKMMKHEQQTNRLEKSSIFLVGNDCLKLNIYKRIGEKINDVMD